MSRHLEKILVWAALIIIAAFSIGGAVGMIDQALRSEVASRQFANNSVESDANRARINKERNCGPLAPLAKAKCISEADYAAHQAEHDDRDLETQRTTAVWTRYLGITGIAGSALGAVGLALLLLTFWANKRSADAAQDANRPWIEGAVPTDIAMGFNSEEIGLSAYVPVTNHGRSPATNVLAQGRLVIISDDEQQRKSALTIHRSGIEAALHEWELRHPHRGKVIYPAKSDKIAVVHKLSIADIRNAEGEPPTKIHYLFVVGVSYRLGRKRARTVTAYLMTIKNNPHLLQVPYNAGAGETRVINSNIVLTDTHEGYAI